MSNQRPFTILCFKCCKRAASFLETRINGGRVKKFTFFHVDGTSCTVEIERNAPKNGNTESDQSWSSETVLPEGDEE